MTRTRDQRGGVGAFSGAGPWARSLAPGLAWAVLACVTAIQPGWAAKPGDSDASAAEATAKESAVPATVTPATTGATSAPAELGKRPPIVYVPPTRGQARHTAGAGTRGAATGMPRVSVLAPRDHVGLTSSAHPRLYWQLAETTSTRIELTVVDDDAIEPLVEVSLPGPIAAGVHVLDLGALGVELAPAKTYRWFVAVVHDPLRRSRDELAEGAIERIALAGGEGAPPPPVLVAGGPRATDALRRASLERAREGLWYDALAMLEDALEQDPANAGLQADREALLAQGNLAIAPRPSRSSR